MTPKKNPRRANAGGLNGVSVSAKRQRPSNEIAPKCPTGPAKERSPKPVASRPPTPEASNARDTVAETSGAWRIIGFVDRTAKRALCACACGQVREVGVEALASGQSQGCGCRQTPRPTATPSRTDSFAEGITGAEAITGRGRHRGRL